MKAKFYLTTLVLLFTMSVSQAQMANTEFHETPSTFEYEGAVFISFTTSLQTYIQEYIVCRTVGGVTTEIGRQDGFEYNADSVVYSFTDFDPIQGQLATYTVKMVDNMDTTLVTTVGTTTITFVTIEELESSAIRNIYPNPVQDQLNIALKDGHSNGLVNIYDANGKLIGSVPFTSNQRTVSLYTQRLPHGVYTVSIQSEDWITNRRVIKN